jgi:thiol-disulfide isomerase/thioredoxin
LAAAAIVVIGRRDLRADDSDPSSKAAAKQTDEKKPAKADDKTSDDKKSDDKRSDEKPTDAKKADSKGGRNEDAILKDLDEAKDKLAEVMPSIASIADTDFRKQDGPKAIAPLKRVSDLLKELSAIQTDETERKQIEDVRCQYLAVLATLDDEDSTALLEKRAAGKHAHALAAKSALVLAKWWRNSKDADAQTKILKSYTQVAKADPTSERVAMTLAVMARTGAANEDVSNAVVAVIRKTLTSDEAKKIAAELDPLSALRELLEKPLVVSGRTTSGKSHTTSDWKGKVVLVDFWATWCGPCNAEIPRVKDLYKTYHPKGLEIVGVDCDADDDTVNSFTKDKEMPWTQLREESQGEKQPWHPLATQYGVNGIPTMFLIDKKGTLRFVDAREGTAEKIEKLLAE